jgi:hypothetical protein
MGFAAREAQGKQGRSCITTPQQTHEISPAAEASAMPFGIEKCGGLCLRRGNIFPSAVCKDLFCALFVTPDGASARIRLDKIKLIAIERVSP